MSKKTKFITIRNQADSATLELYFLDIIQDTYDWWTGMTYSKVQEIIDKVNYYKPSKIKCIIDSGGGDAQTGLSIYNFLKRCDAKVEVEIIGLAGSIASVIAMAANKGKLKIARNGFIMIHKAEGFVGGSSEEIRQAAELVDKYTNQIVDIYSQRTGKPIDDINALIADGDFWMSGEEAVAQGFADETFNDVTENLQIAARLDTSVYKNIPDQVRAQLNPSSTEDNSTNKILSEMSKIREAITNLFKRNTKAEDATEQQSQVNPTAVAELETEITNHIDTTVDERLGSEKVVTTITNKANDAVAAIDFTKDGAPKTAIENAAKTVIENSLAAEGDNPIKTAFNAAVATEVAAKTKDLETEITNLKGKPTNSGEQGEGGKKTVGKFSKG